jgi:epoxyqueuosine reductase
MGNGNLTHAIKEKAYALGYDLCGTIPADCLNDHSVCLDQRVERFPESRQLYQKLYDLASPDKKEAWAKSIIVCVRRYNKYKIPPEVGKYFGKVYLFDGRLAFSEEYKSSRLFEEHLRSLGLRVFKDFAAARWAAVKAGLGQFGKNNFLYTEHGSFVWINTWTVDVKLEYDGPLAPTPICPENCTKCIDACPTEALAEPFAMDRGICIAQLSFYSSAPPSDGLMDRMGTWMYGCDACQDACPKNRNKWIEENEFPELNGIADLLAPEKIAEMDEKTFLEVIQPRFWYIGKEGLWLWRCNAIRAMANSGDPKYHACISRACGDHDEKVRNVARWACMKAGISAA